MSRLCIPCRSWDMQCVQQWCLLEEFLSAACHYKWCAVKQRATISLDGVCHCLQEEISYLEAGGDLSKFPGLCKPARVYHSPCVLLCLWNLSIQALSSSFMQIISKILFSTKKPKQTTKHLYTHKKKPNQNKQTNKQTWEFWVLFFIALHPGQGCIPDSIEGLWCAWRPNRWS